MNTREVVTMLVTEQPDTAAVSCDRCGATFRRTRTDPQSLWVAAEARGWQTERLGGMWWHRCPPCAQGSA
ncbi:hypothetical protein [Dactylosporangium sp. CA-092794]|uniref:hypothetical protein n=1 Tax=Dactylosporangium sp. CA-092794 TaxID=3239929 RepID=UPI003D8AADF5